MNADALIMAMMWIDTCTGDLCEFPIRLAGRARQNFPDLARVFADINFVMKLIVPSEARKPPGRVR